VKIGRTSLQALWSDRHAPACLIAVGARRHGEQGQHGHPFQARRVLRAICVL
jgi:hypothetical protein